MRGSSGLGMEVYLRVLVTWASKRGGTEGIARALGEALQRTGIDIFDLPDLIAVSWLMQRNFVVFKTIIGTRLPLSLPLLVTWTAGEPMSMLPGPKPAQSLTGGLT